MEVKRDYHQTDAGLIPEGWTASRLDALSGGSVPPVKAGPFGSSLTKDIYVAAGYKVYGQEQVIRGDHLYGDYYVSADKYRELESCAVRPGDVLLSLVGTAGKILVVPDDAHPGIINPRLLRLSLDRKRVWPQFLKAILETWRVQNLLTRSAQGGTMGVLNASMLRPLSVPLPPLDEQKSIAAVLSDVDALLSSLDRLIAKKRDLKQSAMQQLLTGQIRLPGFNGKWETKTIDQVAFVTSGKRLPLGSRLTATPTPHPYIRVSDMRPGGVTLDGIMYVPADVFPAIARYRIFKGDLFISVAGTLGIVGAIPESLDGANLTENADRIANITCCREFLLQVLMAPPIQNVIASSQTVGAQPKLALARIRKFAIQFPPTNAEQEAIAAVLRDLDSELSALEQRRNKTRLLKQGMMQELLTGRTRLV